MAALIYILFIFSDLEQRDIEADVGVSPSRQVSLTAQGVPLKRSPAGSDL